MLRAARLGIGPSLKVQASDTAVSHQTGRPTYFQHLVSHATALNKLLSRIDTFSALWLT